MSEWVESPLAELANIVSGGTPSRDVPAYWGGEIPWVTPTDITACRTNYVEQTEDTISKQGLLGSSAKLLPAGAILLTSRASIGLSKIARVPVTTNQGFKSLVPKQGIDGTFLFYQTQRLRGAFERFAAGSTFLEINKKDTERILLPHPTGAVEQKKIATILTGIDTAIEKTEALIAKYQQIKAGLMHDLFTRGVLPNGQLRPPREQTPELYQETAIGWIPREWSLISIGTAFDIQLGKMLNQEAKTGKSSFPYVGNRSVQWDRVDLDALEEMDFSPTEREKFSLKSGDLLVCEGGDVGRTAIWDCPVENCYYQKAIHRLRPKGNQVKPRFMLRFMWYAKNTGHFENYTSQTSIAHLTQEKLASVPMAAPSVDEQDRLIARFDGIDSILDREQDFLANLRQQKSGLMHDLLTGKVPVKVEEAEVVDG
jgi:type I restriction enzyme S subunit